MSDVTPVGKHLFGVGLPTAPFVRPQVSPTRETVGRPRGSVRDRPQRLLLKTARESRPTSWPFRV